MVILALLNAATIIAFFYPQFTTHTVMIGRIIVPIYIHTWMMWQFDNKDICSKSVEEQIEYYVGV